MEEERKEHGAIERIWIVVILNLAVIFISAFTLFPIHMAGGMTFRNPLSGIALNAPITFSLLLLVAFVVYRNREYKQFARAQRIMLVLIVVMIAYFFFSTGFLEAQKAKPDLDRYYPADESSYLYCLSLVVCMFLISLIRKKKVG